MQLTSASYLKFLMSSHNERDADFLCPTTREPAKRLNTYKINSRASIFACELAFNHVIFMFIH